MSGSATPRIESRWPLVVDNKAGANCTAFAFISFFAGGSRVSSALALIQAMYYLELK
jgi:hypothetical protein